MEIARTNDANAAEIETVLRIREEDGAAEVWRGEDLVGFVFPTDEGLRIAFGDCDLGGGPVFVWKGEPISARIDLSGGLAR
jgi:hypothetical protein